MSMSITQKIQEIAAQDPNFRRELMADPRAAIERATGQALPADLDLRVVEEKPNTMYLVLPPAEQASVELEDAELEQVAGGRCPYCMFTKGTYCFFTK